MPCVVWCEDAIAYHGVPTVLFTLHLLVPNIDEAARVLREKGWSYSDNTETNFGMAQLKSAHHCLMPPFDSSQAAVTWTPEMPIPGHHPGKTILLPAAEWNFILPQNNQLDGFPTSLFPPLQGLLDALIDKLLDEILTSSKLWSQLFQLVAYLYGYVPVLKEESFAEKLKYDHRQFHFDCLSGMTIGLPFLRHEWAIRDTLQKGTYQLKDCSADRSDETLFTDKIQARIIASQAPPFTAEDYERDREAFWAAELVANSDSSDDT